jgi:hypothetical protein
LQLLTEYTKLLKSEKTYGGEMLWIKKTPLISVYSYNK